MCVFFSCGVKLCRFFHASNRSYFTTDGRSVSMSWCRAHSGTCGQILLLVGRLLPQSCGLVSVGRPFWREDGTAVCSAITQWSESPRTRNHTLLSHLKLSQPGGPGSRIYISQEQGGNLEGLVPVFVSPRNRVAQLYSRALGSLYIASYDSRGYGGGILTLPQRGGPSSLLYIPQEQDGPVQSHVTADGPFIPVVLCRPVYACIGYTLITEQMWQFQKYPAWHIFVHIRLNSCVQTLHIRNLQPSSHWNNCTKSLFHTTVLPHHMTYLMVPSLRRLHTV
jgi:hypothetical protein